MSLTPAVTAELNLDALRSNLARVRSLAPDSRVLAVIKADGYGHGLIRVAHALVDADGFAVARVEEGVALRRAAIGRRIVVLQGFNDREELAALLTHRLEPVIHCAWQIDALAGRSDVTIRPWLKLDTGMHRLGLTVKEFASAVTRLAHLQPRLMTHLACADEPGHPATPDQLERFQRVTRHLSMAKSIANSAAVLSWPESHADWVRPGLMLYGLSPFNQRSGPELGLTPVMTLKSRLVTIKSLPEGAAVGYGQSWTARRPTRLGLVSAGYGDGYPREIEAGTPVRIGAALVPIVGRVSMDMLTVDLTDHPSIAPGNEVILWGEGLPVETIAASAATIPYTLVCGVTARVQRVERGQYHGTRESRL